MVELDELIPSEAAAALFGAKPQTLPQWRHLGRGPAYPKLAAASFLSQDRYRRLDGEAVCRSAGSTQEPERRVIRHAHRAVDAVAAVNDGLGLAMTAAIEKGATPSAKVIKIKRKRLAAR